MFHWHRLLGFFVIDMVFIRSVVLDVFSLSWKVILSRAVVRYSCGVGYFGSGGSLSLCFRVGVVPTVIFVKNWREESWLNIKKDEISYYIFYQLMSIMCESLRHIVIVFIVIISDQGEMLALLCEILRRISWPQFAFELRKWQKQPFVVIVIWL